jgi:hypothetical protein
MLVLNERRNEMNTLKVGDLVKMKENGINWNKGEIARVAEFDVCDGRITLESDVRDCRFTIMWSSMETMLKRIKQPPVFTNKPSWDDAPEWAEALALDKQDKVWVWYGGVKIEVLEDEQQWLFTGDEFWNFERSGHFEPTHKGWKKSMETRPEEITKELRVGDFIVALDDLITIKKGDLCVVSSITAETITASGATFTPEYENSSWRRVTPEEVKGVTLHVTKRMWQWVCKSSLGKVFLTNFHENEESLAKAYTYKGVTILQRADWTEIDIIDK